MAPHLDHSAPPGAARHNLPAASTSFIGRERERATVAEALASGRLVTITGAGGTGKTRLALAVAGDLAARFPDGAWLVELASLTTPTLLPQAIAEALGVQVRPGGDHLATLLEFLRGRDMLLFLDNCEHLVETCAAFVASALAAAPRLRILATSREALQTGGEQQRRLAPLAVPDPDTPAALAEIERAPAVQLFVARARAVAPDFRLTADNAATVAQICTRLEGIPLAIELAAARVRVLAIEQILARLDDCIRLLTGGSRVGPTRQQTLRATLDWGYLLLSDVERATFRRLAAFAGGWSLEAAEAICAGPGDDPADVLDLLTALVDKSLVQVEIGPDAAWYRLLEPVRQYAARCLDDAGEMDATRARHAAYFADLAARSATALAGPGQLAWLRLLDRDQANLRAALRWIGERGDTARSLRMATALMTYWEARGQAFEGQGWLTGALAATQDDAALAPSRVRAYVALSRLYYIASNYDEAARLSTLGLALAREIGDEAGIAAAFAELGLTERLQRDIPNSTRHLTEALERFRALGDRAGEAFSLSNLGMTTRIAGDTDRAQALMLEGLAIRQDLGDVRQVAIIRTMLGLNATQAGDPSTALAHLADSLAAHHALGDSWFVIFDLLGLAEALLAQDRPGEAARLLGAAQALGERGGTQFGQIGSVTYAPLLAEARARMQDATFAAAWAEGRALPLDRTIAAAMALADAAAPPHQATAPPPTAPTTATLSRREHEVVLLLARGYSDRQIADALSIATGTVGVHVHRILAKLALRSRHQIADWATAQGLTPPGPA